MYIIITIILFFAASFIVKLIIDFNRPLLNRPLYVGRPFSIATTVVLFIMAPISLWQELKFRIRGLGSKESQVNQELPGEHEFHTTGENIPGAVPLASSTLEQARTEFPDLTEAEHRQLVRQAVDTHQIGPEEVAYEDIKAAAIAKAQKENHIRNSVTKESAAEIAKKYLVEHPVAGINGIVEVLTHGDPGFREPAFYHPEPIDLDKCWIVTLAL